MRRPRFARPSAPQVALALGAGALVALLSTAGHAAALSITSVAAGDAHSCGLTAAGGVKCWGSNRNGQLGIGSLVDQGQPTDVAGLASGVAAISAAGDRTCAVMTSGAVKCWGDNGFGQLGDGTTTRRSIPTDVAGLGGGIVAIRSGFAHTCALTSGGTMKCWGDNQYGALGDGTTTSRLTPVDVTVVSGPIVDFSAGGFETCAVTSGGALKCWGIGYGTGAVDIPGLGSGVAKVSTYYLHTCVVTVAGGAKCWGDNRYGKLGDGTTVSRATPTDVPGLTSGVTGIVAGLQHTCAMTTEGRAWCWGNNLSGQVGDLSMTAERWRPVPVAGLASGVTSVALGGFHSCASTDSGSPRCWGLDNFGQLGAWTETSNLPVPLISAGANQAIAFPSIAMRGLGDAPFALSASASSGLPIAFTSLSPAVCSVSGSTVSLAAKGICTIAANQRGDDVYAAAPQVARSFTVLDVNQTLAPRLSAISTRIQVLPGEGVLIAGFVITGSARKTVIVRARGPSLAGAGVANALPNPMLQLFSGSVELVRNAEWQDDYTRGNVTPGVISEIGFAPANFAEAAVLAVLEPGAYTAIVSDVASGVGIVEVFEMDAPDSPFAGIATRGRVSGGDNVMIAGFVIEGNASQTVIVRAGGPSLASQGVSAPLPNPLLQLVRASDNTVIATNDDWGSAPNASSMTASGLAPANALESAILITLQPGAYTAILSGRDGATGVGILEVYAVP